MKLERKDLVLKYIVEEFIKTAQPVGSKNLLEKYKDTLDCSSATIRNVMAALEDEGMLEKTHVSSGRVPSAKGYNYYLENLDRSEMTESVDMEFQREFQEVLANKSKSVEDVIQSSCEMLSEMTQMATVVLGPKANEEALVSIQLIKLSETSAMEILITDSGYVEKKTFVINKGDKINFETLSNAVKLLNDRLTGTKISELEIKAKALQPIITSTFGKDGTVLIQAFIETLVSFTRKRFTVYGQKNLLSLPEFQEDSDAFLNAVEALEDPERLQKGVRHQDDLGFINVGFTNENKGDFAIVSKPINSKDQIAIVGPKRMDYKKIMSALEYVAYMLNKYFFSQTNTGSSLIPISEVSSTPEIPEEAETPKPKKTTAKKKKGGKK